jgi:hypothetical protein
MKKLKIGDPKIIEQFINKELENYGVTMEDVKNYPDGIIEGLPWYQYYTFKTHDDHDEWKNWCIDFLKTQVTPKLRKDRINVEFAWFDLMYGLKVEEEMK